MIYNVLMDDFRSNAIKKSVPDLLEELSSKPGTDLCQIFLNSFLLFDHKLLMVAFFVIRQFYKIESFRNSAQVYINCLFS